MLLNQSPGLWRFLQVCLLILLYNCEACRELSSGKNVEATLHFFFSMLVRNSAKRHIIETLLFLLTFFTSFIFKLVFGLVPYLFSLVSCVLFNQSLFIVNLHVYWIIHESLPTQSQTLMDLLLHSQRKLFTVVLAVNLSFGVTLLLELLLFVLIVVLHSQ